MEDMVEHEGIVRFIKGGKAVVAVETGGCGGCSHQSGCGLGRIGGERKTAEMTVAAEDWFKPGARVILSLPQERVLTANLVAYLLPTLGLLLGSGLAYGNFGSDGATALGAIAGLLGGILLTRAVPGWAPTPSVRPANR